VATVDHPATSALSATSGTFTGNIIIPNSGNIGSVGDTDAVTITSAGLVGLNNTSPSSALAVNANLNDQWAGRFENTNSGGYGVLSRTTASTTSDIAFRVDKNGSETALNVDGAGHVTMPYQPAFLVTPSTQQDNINGDGSDVDVAFGSEIFDNNADFASSTFTAPVTGRYFFTVSLRFENVDTASAYVQIYLLTSNRIIKSIQSTNVFSGDIPYLHVHMTSLSDMDANDTCKIQLQLESSGASQADVDPNSFFSGHLVC
tara:strand:- start:40 stop:819 length:780 start_codon:yes stop_codon:yes gene_type:complete